MSALLVETSYGNTGRINCLVLGAKKPFLYYRNNCVASRNFIETRVDKGESEIVFFRPLPSMGHPTPIRF